MFFFVGFAALTAVVMKSSVFRDIALRREFIESQPTFWRNMSSPSSRLKSKPNKKPARNRQQTKLGLPFNPEDGGDMFLRNVG
jgi:hypothetical protein